MGSGTISSMTGFGRADAETPAGRLTVEVRTLNSRHLEVSVKGPRELAGLEMDVRRATRERLERGKVDVFLTLESVTREFVVDRRGLARPTYSVNVGPMIHGATVVSFPAVTARLFRVTITLKSRTG